MDPRTLKVFVPTFLLTFLGLAGSFFAIDVLLNLDELFARSGPEAPLLGMAVRYCSGMVSLHGGTPVGALALASAASAFVATRRKVAPRSGTVG